MHVEENNAGISLSLAQEEMAETFALEPPLILRLFRLLQGKGGWAWVLSPLWLCLLAALIMRVWLTLRTHGTLDGDEALLGIQAQHILQGERPIYFYGIPYFGSMEAYLVAGLFALFGPSVAALRAETTAFGLLLVAATWWLATLLARRSGLSPFATRCFTLVAGLVAAIPPVYDGIIEMRTGGGWIESFVLMLLLLIAMLRLTTRWNEGAANSELAWRWALFGFLVGFSMWIYPLVSVAILATFLWLLGDRVGEIIRRVRAAEPIRQATFQALKQLPLAVAALPACLIGFAPGIYWGAMNQWENLHYIFGLGGGWTINRLKTVAKVTEYYGACVAPRVISGATPKESPLLTVIHAPLLLLGIVGIGATFALILGSYRWPHPVLLSARRLAVLPALLGVCSGALYCVSKASTAILISCQDDFGGRYASPLVLALPFFLATAFTLLATLFFQKKSGSRAVLSAYADNASAGIEPVPGPQPFSRKVFAIFLTILVVYLAGQAVTYGLTNQDLAFQSAYCTLAPANYSPIISYMQQEKIKYAWGTNLLAYPISFETDNAIIMADPAAVTHSNTTINRIPAYTDAVTRADRATFLVFITHGNAHPHLLQVLDAMQVTYKTAVFPSQPGVDVMVVTPLNRSASPFESKYMDLFYCSVQ